MNQDWLQSTDLLREFKAEGWELPPSVTSHAVWKRIVNGQLPAQKIGGRYWIDRTNKPAIAEALGLTRAPVAKPGRKAPATPASAAA